MKLALLALMLFYINSVKKFFILYSKKWSVRMELLHEQGCQKRCPSPVHLCQSSLSI